MVAFRLKLRVFESQYRLVYASYRARGRRKGVDSAEAVAIDGNAYMYLDGPPEASTRYLGISCVTHDA